jgi:hypothetical protein
MSRKSKNTIELETVPTISNTDNAKVCCASEPNYINRPPKVTHRNHFGLIEDESIKYIYNDDGTINWRAMIPKEFLVVNKQAFKNKPVPDTIDGLKDNELLTLLGGSKYLASLRGFESVNYVVNSSSENYVVATCTIKWIRNYETEGREISFSAIGDAHPRNTSSFASNYLGAIAENRAFVRAVRNFLRIQVLSQEEVGGTIIEVNSNDDGATKMFTELLNKYQIPFDKLRAKLIEEKFAGAEAFNNIGDIPKYQMFSLIARIKDKYEKKPESATA